MEAAFCTSGKIRSEPTAAGVTALTAFDGVRSRLQRNGPAIGLVDVDTEHQPDTCVFAPNVCLSFAKLDVRIAQF